MNNDLYQFPATRFISNTPWQQWRHLFSEVMEIAWALICNNYQHAAAESWDVKHSAETLQRILSGHGADIEMARENVISNNMERGYYNQHLSEPPL